jgi:acyl dehydratase
MAGSTRGSRQGDSMKVADLVRQRPLPLGTSSWRQVTQEQITGFADVTGDHQWIHVDPETAALSPFGGTIAHGYLLLSLVPQMVDEIMVLEDRRLGVNYGANRLRFTGPVRSGTRVRARLTLLSGRRRADGGVLTTLEFVLEREAADPALVAELLILSYGDESSR